MATIGDAIVFLTTAYQTTHLGQLAISGGTHPPATAARPCKHAMAMATVTAKAPSLSAEISFANVSTASNSAEAAKG